MLYQSSKRTCIPSSVLLYNITAAYTNNKICMQVVLRALSIQDKVYTCRSSHLDKTKKVHVRPNYALYFGPVAHFGPAGPKLDADRNTCIHDSTFKNAWVYIMQSLRNQQPHVHVCI